MMDILCRVVRMPLVLTEKRARAGLAPARLSAGRAKKLELNDPNHLMKTKALVSALPVLAASLLAAPAQTNQATAIGSQPALSPAEQIIQDIKNPVPWLS